MQPLSCWACCFPQLFTSIHVTPLQPKFQGHSELPTVHLGRCFSPVDVLVNVPTGQITPVEIHTFRVWEPWKLPLSSCSGNRPVVSNWFAIFVEGGPLTSRWWKNVLCWLGRNEGFPQMEQCHCCWEVRSAPRPCFCFGGGVGLRHDMLWHNQLESPQKSRGHDLILCLQLSLAQPFTYPHTPAKAQTHDFIHTHTHTLRSFGIVREPQDSQKRSNTPVRHTGAFNRATIAIKGSTALHVESLMANLPWYVSFVSLIPDL